MSETDSPIELLRRRFHQRNPLVVNLLSEFFATTLLLFVGTGICAQFILSEGKLNTWFHINLGWGILVALCVYGTFYTSGGHMNPAVSLAMVTMGKLSFHHFLLYSVVQTVGAFIGAGLSFSVYSDEIHHFINDVHPSSVELAGVLRINGAKATAGMLCSFPQDHISNTTAFIDQVVGTALLVLFIATIIDKRNRIPEGMQPLLFGLGLFVVGASYGMNVGYPINPARDFGPRLFALWAGYGWEVFSYHRYYFWIPIVAPLIGGPLGAWLYQAFVGIHLPDSPPHQAILNNIAMSETLETNLNPMSKKNMEEMEPLNDGMAC